MWTTPTADLALADNIIHVWRASLNVPSAGVQRYRDILAVDERLRADRFRFEHDRRRFTVARGILRTILSHYLRRDPVGLCFYSNEYGKPALAHDTIPIHFNVSHSADLALFAIALNREVGVDVEEVRDIEVAEVAAAIFSLAEQAAIRMQPAHLQLASFFTCWTRKEAYVKARGVGLSLPLDQFDVSLSPKHAVLRYPYREPEAHRTWSLQELAPGPGFVGALAAKGFDWHTLCCQFEP